MGQGCTGPSGRSELKKKALEPDPGGRKPQQSAFKSIFSKEGKAAKAEKKAPPVFLPPEAFGSSPLGFDEDDLATELASASAWDVATRYHEFKSKKSSQSVVRELRRLSARAILERAQAVMGSVVHPVDQRIAPWPEVPGDVASPDFDFDETLENAPLAMSGLAPVTAQDIWMDYTVPRRQSVVLSVDTSLSMTGEKLALTAVAIAVVLLQFPDDPVGIVAFENEPKVLKRPDERISLQLLLERFLDVPAQGYTHLEDGLKGALALVRTAGTAGQSRPPSTVLLTDGKYTAGRDPAYLAHRFPHLVVLKMGKERASLELCREMAQKGHGVLCEVGELEALPNIMYGVVKDLLRGRSPT